MSFSHCDNYPSNDALTQAIANFAGGRGPMLMTKQVPTEGGAGSQSPLDSSPFGQLFKMFFHPEGHLALKPQDAPEDASQHLQLFKHGDGVFSIHHSAAGVNPADSQVADHSTLLSHMIHILPHGVVSAVHTTDPAVPTGLQSILAKLMNHHVQVNSDPKHGSVICLVLKHKPAQEEQPAPQKLLQPTPSPTPAPQGLFLGLFGKLQEMFLHPHGYLAVAPHGVADQQKHQQGQHKQVYMHAHGVLTVTHHCPNNPNAVGMVATLKNLADKLLLIHHPNGILAAVPGAGDAPRGAHAIVMHLKYRHVVIHRSGFVCAKPLEKDASTQTDDCPHFVHSGGIICHPSGFPHAQFSPTGLMGLIHSIVGHPNGLTLKSEFPPHDSVGLNKVVHHQIFVHSNHALSIVPMGEDGKGQIADLHLLSGLQPAVHNTHVAMVIPAQDGAVHGMHVIVRAFKHTKITIHHNGHLAAQPSAGAPEVGQHQPFAGLGLPTILSDLFSHLNLGGGAHSQAAEQAEKEKQEAVARAQKEEAVRQKAAEEAAAEAKREQLRQELDAVKQKLDDSKSETEKHQEAYDDLLEKLTNAQRRTAGQ